MKTISYQPFSQELSGWLTGKNPKTVAGLLRVSHQKSFAVLFLVLMAIPALPLPTGGVSHVFELITILAALQLAGGRKVVWLPKKWLRRPLGKNLETRTIPYLIQKIRWLEKHSSPRLAGVIQNYRFLQLAGVLVAVLSLCAFLAPPFSGLDTLPAMGVVGISLGLLLEDMAVIIAALLLGIIGVLLELSVGAAIFRLF